MVQHAAVTEVDQQRGIAIAEHVDVGCVAPDEQIRFGADHHRPKRRRIRTTEECKDHADGNSQDLTCPSHSTPQAVNHPDISFQ